MPLEICVLDQEDTLVLNWFLSALRAALSVIRDNLVILSYHQKELI